MPVFFNLHVLVNGVLGVKTVLSGIVTSDSNAAESTQAELVTEVIVVGSGLGVESIIGRVNTALTPLAITVYVPLDRSFIFNGIVVSKGVVD